MNVNNPDIKVRLPQQVHKQWTDYITKIDQRSNQTIIPYLKEYIDGKLDLDFLPYLKTTPVNRDNIIHMGCRVPIKLHIQLMRKTAKDEVKAGSLVRSIIEYIMLKDHGKTR